MESTSDVVIATWELITTIQKMRFEVFNQVKLVCDSQVVLHIASNLVFHVRTKRSSTNLLLCRRKDNLRQ